MSFNILKLNDQLTQKFGSDWFHLEEETLSLELGVTFDALHLQGVRLLKALLWDASSDIPDDDDGKTFGEPRIETDPLFLIHSSDIINGSVVDPTTISMPTALELAYTLFVLYKLPIHFTPRTSVRMVCEHVLKQDGYLAPVPPFTNFVPDSVFSAAAEWTDADKEQRVKAIKAYIFLKEKESD